MTNVYEINRDVIIGIKKMTPADLGSNTSHQTHIGLFAETLSNLPYIRANYFSKLYYDNQVFDGVLFLKFINNNRSPAINLGTAREQAELEDNTVSIGAKIRDIANGNRNLSWFLIWFVLDNEEIITIVFSELSSEFIQITNLGFDLANIRQHGFQIDTNDNPILSNYLTNYINNQSLSYLEDLEIIVQTDDLPLKLIKPRYFDIERARKVYSETGKKGEELIAAYLDKLKSSGKITNFNWVNQSRESSYPYDFEIIDLAKTSIYTDVKTTSYTFNQEMIFSKSELSYINQSTNYHVYRVFDLKEKKPSLRICEDVSQLSKNLVDNITTFQNQILQNQANLNSLKLAISPSNNLLSFNNAISLV